METPKKESGFKLVNGRFERAPMNNLLKNYDGILPISEIELQAINFSIEFICTKLKIEVGDFRDMTNKFNRKDGYVAARCLLVKFLLQVTKLEPIVIALIINQSTASVSYYKNKKIPEHNNPSFNRTYKELLVQITKQDWFIVPHRELTHKERCLFRRIKEVNEGVIT